MNFIDEEHVALLEIGQQCGKIARLGDNRPGGGAEIDAELLGHDLRQRRLAEAGRTDKQHVIQRLAAPLGCLDEDLQIGARLRLAGKFVQRLRPERRIDIFAPLFRRYQTCGFTHVSGSIPGMRCAAPIPKAASCLSRLKYRSMRQHRKSISPLGNNSQEHGRCKASPREFLEAEADQLGAVGAFPGRLQGCGHGIGGLIAGIAEIGERGNGIGDGRCGNPISQFLLEPDIGRIAGKDRRLVLEFRHDAHGNLWTDARRSRNSGTILQGDRIRKLGRRQCRQQSKRYLGANTLNRLHDVEPFALQHRHEAEKTDLILAHIGLDEENAGLADGTELRQRSGRAIGGIADAVHIHEHIVFADLFDCAFELADHG
ncbi:hypothetical protein RHSP_25949 [Rhizobium freirei PRF 81]|uniref:Uncharacterized protein n=1 Tax=Rhizobium freirei PRF 81 TaxID=363754 RepID=N6V2J9_9HYPH|nr:hypothetical protein RHSP_25949 [Rhizobium freirei PRF 81]